ncbi:MAG: FHA domain-containing protein [Myxococcales bacterium]|nr:FHA domain-containing protein [Myxococcales bacterium]
MGVLERADGARRIALGGRVLAGRGERCDLRLASPRASGEHAVLTWRDGGWHVRDLGSRNGTLIDGEPLAPGGLRPLPVGATLQLGDADEQWRLVADGPPEAVAVDAAGVFRHAVDGLLALPDPEDPATTVFAAANGRWLAEVAGAPRFVQDADWLEDRWQILLPVGGEAAAATTMLAGGGPSVDRLVLRFAVSQDEEFVQLRVQQGAQLHALPTRGFHYLLLTLARLRHEAPDDVSEAEAGWVYVEDLCRMLDTDPPRLNVDIYRARQQLAALGVREAGRLVERRATSRQLRLGIAGLEIERL